MANRGIGSYDDLYKFQLFSEVTAVSHVRDEDLAALKAQHPAEQVRLSQAGIEGNQELIAAIERVSFFQGSPAAHTFILPLLAFGNWSYMSECDSRHGDELTDRMNGEDGADVQRRDFTGLDCTGWVYDLFTPAEPYSARGVHPSGVGIDGEPRRSAHVGSPPPHLRRRRWPRPHPAELRPPPPPRRVRVRLPR
jgi:hypothetical protein